MALSHKDWELPNSRLSLKSILTAVEIFPSRPVMFCGEKVAQLWEENEHVHSQSFLGENLLLLSLLLRHSFH